MSTNPSESDVSPSCADKDGEGSLLKALLLFQLELDKWNTLNSPSESGYLVEDVPKGHPLHSAVVALEKQFDSGSLPKPALRYWRNFLKLARIDDEKAEDEADKLIAWVKVQLQATTTSELTSHSESGPEQVNPYVGTTHCPDFRSVIWFGEQYDFTTMQAACVRVLWENWERGTPGMAEITILDKAGSAGDRLRDVFTKGEHPAWGTMIIRAKKGAYKLTSIEEI